MLPRPTSSLSTHIDRTQIPQLSSLMMKLATLCYVRRNDQTLMLYRNKKKNDMHEGKWNGLGGKFEPGETPEACAVREIYEESGLTVNNPQLQGVLTFPAFADHEDWYAFVFVARDFRGELIESSEGELAWIDNDRLTDLNLWAGDHIFLDWLEQERLFSARFDYVDGRLTDYEVSFYPLSPRAEAGATGGAA